jgi:hypothetical protein
VENGIVTIVPPPFEPKTIASFQEGNGKGEANVEAPTKTNPPELTSIQQNTSMFPLSTHISNIDGKKQSLPRIKQTITEQVHTTRIIMGT